MKNKTSLKRFLIAFFLSFVAMTSSCNGKQEKTENTPSPETSSPISFEKLYVVLPPPVASATSVYGSIKNISKSADTLIDISSNAGMVMLHQSVVESGKAQMIHIDSYEIKPNEALILKPMSYHIMLMNIDHNIVKKDGKIQLTFTFKNAGQIDQEVPVIKQ